MLVALAMRVEAAILVVFGFAIPPIMQDGVVKVARAVAPDAVATASGMNVSAFNLGISGSGGSFIGCRVVEGPGLTATPYAAIAMVVVALGITILIGKSQTLRAGESVAS